MMLQGRITRGGVGEEEEALGGERGDDDDGDMIESGEVSVCNVRLPLPIVVSGEETTLLVLSLAL